MPTMDPSENSSSEHQLTGSVVFPGLDYDARFFSTPSPAHSNSPTPASMRPSISEKPINLSKAPPTAPKPAPTLLNVPQPGQSSNSHYFNQISQQYRHSTQTPSTSNLVKKGPSADLSSGHRVNASAPTMLQYLSMPPLSQRVPSGNYNMMSGRTGSPHSKASSTSGYHKPPSHTVTSNTAAAVTGAHKPVSDGMYTSQNARSVSRSALELADTFKSYRLPIATPSNQSSAAVATPPQHSLFTHKQIKGDGKSQGGQFTNLSDLPNSFTNSRSQTAPSTHIARQESDRPPSFPTTPKLLSPPRSSLDMRIYRRRYRRFLKRQRPKTEEKPKASKHPSNQKLDSGFDWSSFLRSNKANTVPHFAFKHIEESLLNGFLVGMKVETPLRDDNTDKYWLATVVAVYGNLVKLRYDGFANNSRKDFLMMSNSGNIHPIGWCSRHAKSLLPPADIRHTQKQWKDFLLNALQGAKTISPSLLSEPQPWLFSRIKIGMRLEVQHGVRATSVWVATVIANLGGRLKLKYLGSNNPKQFFWMFFLDNRLHVESWAKSKGYIYRPPEEIQVEHSYGDWAQVLHNAGQLPSDLRVPTDLFLKREPKHIHNFKVGMRVEAVNPKNPSRIYPARVKAVISSCYFVVEIDDLREEEAEKSQICCTSSSPGIFPPGWCAQRRVKLSPPKGWKEQDFSWQEYAPKEELASKSLFMLPYGERERSHKAFSRNQQLEAVNPVNPAEICAAQVVRTIDRLLWVTLNRQGSQSTFIYDFESYDLFPAGWCEANKYPLSTPDFKLKDSAADHKPARKSVNEKSVKAKQNGEPPVKPSPLPKQQDSKYEISKTFIDDEWCPKLYFNQTCRAGSYINQLKLPNLPDSVGPGPLSSVLKEAISKLIEVSSKPPRTIALMEPRSDSQVTYPVTHIPISMTYKGRNFASKLELCATVQHLPAFCKTFCERLACCPYFFCQTPVVAGTSCPENCFKIKSTRDGENTANKKTKKKRRHATEGQSNKFASELSLQRRSSAIEPPAKQKYIPPPLKPKKEPIDDKASNYVPPDPKPIMLSVVPPSQSAGAQKPDAPIKKRKGRPPKRPKEDPETVTHNNSQPESAEQPQSAEQSTTPANLPPLKIRRTKPNLNEAGVSDGLLKPSLPLNMTRSALTFTHPRVHVADHEIVTLADDPTEWTSQQVANFLEKTDCKQHANAMVENDIDGEAFLLLVLPAIHEHLDMKLGPALKLAHQVQRLKLSYFKKYKPDILSNIDQEISKVLE